MALLSHIATIAPNSERRGLYVRVWLLIVPPVAAGIHPGLHTRGRRGVFGHSFPPTKRFDILLIPQLHHYSRAIPSHSTVELSDFWCLSAPVVLCISMT